MNTIQNNYYIPTSANEVGDDIGSLIRQSAYLTTMYYTMNRMTEAAQYLDLFPLGFIGTLISALAVGAAARGIYDQYTQAQGDEDGRKLVYLMKLQSADDLQDPTNFRRNCEPTLRRIQEHDHEAAQPFIDHYKMIVSQMVPETDISWGEGKYKHAYRMDSEGVTHHYRQACAATKTVVRRCIVGDHQYDPNEQEARYHRAREKSYRQHFNFREESPERSRTPSPERARTPSPARTEDSIETSPETVKNSMKYEEHRKNECCPCVVQ
jgi:hypothetical protein